ncbi:recombinase family protein [Brevibacterium pityocampae]|uniref:Recombinase family protein n=1 Tax=Brevibacterium pityocampae TaxID=506594 RepID=A0ABP8JSJ8_9MICO
MHVDNSTSVPRRAAIYLRISLDRDNNRRGVTRHREDAEQLIEHRGWTQVDVYEDNDTTGSGRKSRPAFERLLTDIDKGLVDVVVAQEWPRLERNRIDGVRIIEAAQRHHVLLTFAKGNDIDCSTSMGRLAADLFSAVARNEIEAKAERQSRAQLQRAQQGRAPKGVRPLGYATNGDLIEDEAAVVHEMFRLFAIDDGPSVAAIARGLSGEVSDVVPKTLPHLPKRSRTLAIERNERRKAEGLPLSPVPADGPWDSSTVLGILRNPRYAGYSVYTDRTDREKNKRRTWHAQVLRDENGDPVMGQWTPIVEPDVWWRVQDRLNEPRRITNKTGSTARKHIGSGLYLCGICEQPVRAHSLRYRCEGHLMRSRKQIDDWVIRVIRERLSRPDLADALVLPDEPRLDAIRELIAKHEAKIKRAQADYDAEIVEGFDLKRIRDAENAEIAQLEQEKRQLTTTEDLGGVLDAADPVAAFDEADLMIKRRVIEFFATVRLYPHPRGKKTFDPETVQITPKS